MKRLRLLTLLSVLLAGLVLTACNNSDEASGTPGAIPTVTGLPAEAPQTEPNAPVEEVAPEPGTEGEGGAPAPEAPVDMPPTPDPYAPPPTETPLPADYVPPTQ